jgi:hypothetical protein
MLSPKATELNTSRWRSALISSSMYRFSSICRSSGGGTGVAVGVGAGVAVGAGVYVGGNVGDAGCVTAGGSRVLCAAVTVGAGGTVGTGVYVGSGGVFGPDSAATVAAGERGTLRGVAVTTAPLASILASAALIVACRSGVANKPGRVAGRRSPPRHESDTTTKAAQATSNVARTILCCLGSVTLRPDA